MSDLVEAFAERGVLSTLDRHFARALGRLAPSSAPEVLLAAAFASRAVRMGNVCADLVMLTETPLLNADEQPVIDVLLPALSEWQALLERSDLVCGDTGTRPLVLDRSGRLYLYRYWTYERHLAARISRQCEGFESVIPSALNQTLVRMFPGALTDEGERKQRFAAVLALFKRFVLISGGPGTGKTHTVVKILGLLQQHARSLARSKLRMLLVAPTGKAATRLGESIMGNLKLVLDDDLASTIPSSVATIHRALGYQARTPTSFRHNANNLLPIDVLLVDEASMIDVALLSKLFDAVPEHARIILLGDKDQLASVEAGAILGDIYNPDLQGRYSPRLLQHMSALTGESAAAGDATGSDLGDCVVHLTKSYRYPARSGIALLARAVNEGDADAALGILGRPAMPAHNEQASQLAFDFGQPAHSSPPYTDIGFNEAADTLALSRTLLGTAERGLAQYCRERDIRHKLAMFASFRVLCAHRRGDFGVESLNQSIEEHLASRGLLTIDRDWYDGRPILITRNDYPLELFNGDVGIIASPSGPARAYFLGPKGLLRSFLPARLPPHETVFAMTVHKSQGSEFDRVALILPPRPSPVVTRELVYTAITRARRRVDIYGTVESLRTAISTRIQRASGLRDALWNQPQVPPG